MGKSKKKGSNTNASSSSSVVSNNNNQQQPTEIFTTMTSASPILNKKSMSGNDKQQQQQYQQQLHQLQQQQIQQQKKILLQQQQQVSLTTINVDKHSIDQSFLSSNLDVLKSSQQGVINGGGVNSNSGSSSSTQPTNSNTKNNNNNSNNNDNTPKQKTFMGDVPTSALYSFRFGNNEYYKERYKTAIDHYNTAISLSSSKNPMFLVVVLINRSITKLKLQEYKKSILDSTLAISIQPNCIKAYICRSFGYFFSKDFKKAFADHLIATNLAPHNFSLQRVMRYAHGSLFMYNADFFDYSLNNLAKIKSIQLEWLSDFNLLSIEEEPCRMHLLVKYMKEQIVKNKENQLQQQQQQQAAAQQQQQQQQLTQNIQNNSNNNNNSNNTNNNNQQNIFKSPNGIPSLIPMGEFTNGSWTDLEEYYSLYTPVIGEQLASKQKLLGNSDFQDKKYEAALGHYSKAIKLNPEDPIYYSNRGIVYYKLHRFYEAITDCSMSIDKQAKQFKAYLRRGSSFAAIGDYANAIRDFKAGLKYEPESIDLIDGLYKALKWIENDLKKRILVATTGNNPTNTLELSLKSVSFELSFIAAKLNSTKNTLYDSTIFQQSISTNPSTTTPTTTTTSTISTSTPSTTASQQPISNTNQLPNPSPISSTNSPFLSFPQQNPNLNNPPPLLSKSHQEKLLQLEIEKEKQRLLNLENNEKNETPVAATTTTTNVNNKKPTTSTTQVIPSNKKKYACFRSVTVEKTSKLESLISYLTDLIISRTGDTSLILFTRAEVYAQLNDPQSAFRDYDNAIQLNSKYTDIPKRYQRLKQILKEHN